MQDNTAEFWEQRPELSEMERELMCLYRSIRREAESDKPVKSAAIKEALKTVIIEQDVGVRIIQALDDYYLELIRDEMKRRKRKP